MDWVKKKAKGPGSDFWMAKSGVSFFGNAIEGEAPCAQLILTVAFEAQTCHVWMQLGSQHLSNHVV